MTTGIVLTAVGLNLDNTPTSIAHNEHLVQQVRRDRKDRALIEPASKVDEPSHLEDEPAQQVWRDRKDRTPGEVSH